MYQPYNIKLYTILHIKSLQPNIEVIVNINRTSDFNQTCIYICRPTNFVCLYLGIREQRIFFDDTMQ